MNHLTLSGLLVIFLITGLSDHITRAAKVSGTSCSGDGECTADHSECDTSAGMCKCSDTYVESKPDGTSCDHAVQAQTTKVSETSCSGNGDCTVDHSECDTSAQMCKCSDTYVESKPDGTSCDAAVQAPQIKVSGMSCSGDGECTVDHSECDTSAGMCKCSDTFAESKPDGTSCDAAVQAQTTKVSGTSCSGDGDCTVDHSECDTSAGMCKCSDTFIESKPDGTSCVQVPTMVNSVECTAIGRQCDAIKHAECNTKTKKCQCSAGFKITVNTCSADNAGDTTTWTFVVLAIPAILLMREAFGNVL